jgi:hypothetical protein
MEQSLSLAFSISNLSLMLFGRSSIAHVINSIVLLGLVLATLYISRSLTGYFNRAKQDLVFLKLTPAAFQDDNSSSFSDLFKLIHGINSNRNIRERLLRPKPIVSFEVVSTHEGGISFVLGVPEELVGLIKRSIKASLNNVVIEGHDHSLKLNNKPKAYSFKLKKPYYFSLKTKDVPGYLSCLGNLDPNESIAFQLVLSPVSARFNNKARRTLRSKKSSNGWLIKLFKLPFEIIKFILNLNKSRNEINELSQEKFELPLYSASLRLVIDVPSDVAAKQRLKGFKAGLATYSNPGVQGLISESTIWSKLYIWQFKHRLPSFSLRQKTIMSSDELSSLYHFPHRDNNEDVNTSLSRTLPTPLLLKRTKSFDVVIGESRKDDKVYNLGLSEEERVRHVYIVGGTGNGKTTMLEYMVTQDMKNGKGLAVIDPHGDMAESILKYVPKERIKDVIYFNPEDIDYPIGINLMELPKTLTGSEYIRQKDLVVEAVISVLRKIFEGDESNSAFRIERLLRNAIYSAMTVPDATIFTVLRLLSDKYYRWEVIKDLKDESLKRFWQEEYNKAGDFQRVKLSQGPITRLERFERSMATKRILSQPKSTVNFDDILSSGKILICNLPKGNLGEDTSALLGAIVLAKIQLAAWRRSSIEPAKRRPFCLYIDEFQNFANKSYMSLFSEARKYGLSITMAQQSVAQLKDKDLVNSLLDNTGTLVAFRSKSQATEKLLHDQFEPYVTRSELANLSRYNFYAKIAATEPYAPVSGTTILTGSTLDDVTPQQVIASSRKLYGFDYNKSVILTKH